MKPPLKSSAQVISQLTNIPVICGPTDIHADKQITLIFYQDCIKRIDYLLRVMNDELI